MSCCARYDSAFRPDRLLLALPTPTAHCIGGKIPVEILLDERRPSCDLRLAPTDSANATEIQNTPGRQADFPVSRPTLSLLYRDTKIWQTELNEILISLKILGEPVIIRAATTTRVCATHFRPKICDALTFANHSCTDIKLPVQMAGTNRMPLRLVAILSRLHLCRKPAQKAF